MFLSFSSNASSGGLCFVRLSGFVAVIRLAERMTDPAFLSTASSRDCGGD